jgi:SAM-dependent methyltransferase
MAMENWHCDHPVEPLTIESDPRPGERFLLQALADLGGFQPRKVLDFGCGSGRFVRSLRLLGLDASGCDVVAAWKGSDDPCVKHLSVMDLQSPLRLPFPDEAFDSVVSTSVLEHADNKDEIFSEIYRILTPGGQMLHFFPGKFYLPLEPHLYVPLLNWLWPHVPRWWLALWAILGIRNEFQGAMGWREVVDANVTYVETGISWWTHGRLRRAVEHVFGNCEFPNRYYILRAPGGVARMCRHLPFKSLTGWASGQFRMGFLYAKKLR